MPKYINEKDTLNQGRQKLNKSIEQSDRAENKSDEAVDTANEAKSTANSTKAEFDQVVIEGDSSVEAAQARVDADGNSHATLKERLDTEHTGVTSQLAHEVNERQSVINDLDDKKADKNAVRERTDDSPIKMAELHTEVKEGMTGGSVPVVGVSSVGEENLKFRSVTPEKIRGASINLSRDRENLFDHNNLEEAFINTSNGNVYPSDNNFVTDFIPVAPEAQYVTLVGVLAVFYDENQDYLEDSDDQQRSNDSSTFWTPESCHYIRVQLSQVRYNEFGMSLYEGHSIPDEENLEPAGHFRIDKQAAETLEQIYNGDYELFYEGDRLVKVEEYMSNSLYKTTHLNYDNDTLSVVYEENHFNLTTQKTTLSNNNVHREFVMGVGQ